MKLPVEKEYLQANPLFQVAIDSLNRTELGPTTTGYAAGSMPQIRKASEDGLEKALIGRDPLGSMQSEKKNVGEERRDHHRQLQRFGGVTRPVRGCR